MILCQTGSAQSLSGKAVPAQSSAGDSQGLLVLVVRGEALGQGSHPRSTPIPGEGGTPAAPSWMQGFVQQLLSVECVDEPH